MFAINIYSDEVITRLRDKPLAVLTEIDGYGFPAFVEYDCVFILFKY